MLPSSNEHPHHWSYCASLSWKCSDPCFDWEYVVDFCHIDTLQSYKGHMASRITLHTLMHIMIVASMKIWSCKAQFDYLELTNKLWKRGHHIHTKRVTLKTWILDDEAWWTSFPTKDSKSMLQRMGPFMNNFLFFEYCSVISGILARRTRILKILSCFGQVHMHDVKHDLYNICLVFKDFIAFAALIVRWPSLGKSHPRGVTGLFTGWVG